MVSRSWASTATARARWREPVGHPGDVEHDGSGLHFDWKKPLLGRTKGGLTLGDDLHIEHPLLKSAVTVRLSQVAAVVHVRSEDPGPPEVRRELRRLDLSPEAAVGDRVAIVLRDPVPLVPSGSEPTTPWRSADGSDAAAESTLT